MKYERIIHPHVSITVSTASKVDWLCPELPLNSIIVFASSTELSCLLETRNSLQSHVYTETPALFANKTPTMMMMPWPFGVKTTVVVVVLVALGMGISPTRIANRTIYLVYHSPGLVFTSLRVKPPAPHTLKASILNVTADFNELALLLQDFMHSPAVDPSVEASFRHFLADRATRSHPGLENILDWVLALYKFAFPFLIISLLAKLSGGSGGGGSGSEDTSESDVREGGGGGGYLVETGDANNGGRQAIARRQMPSTSDKQSSPTIGGGTVTPKEGSERSKLRQDLLAAAVAARQK